MHYFIKRLIDIVGTVFIGIVFLPIALATAIAIKLDSPGPLLADTPERVGQGGKLFKLYKFRSMIVNAHEMLRSDPKLKKLYEQYKKNSYKLYIDPRVTRVGKFIRKHSLDEMPQLVNVLKGEMSLVGPRPYYADELVNQQKKYPHTKELVNVVLSAKPGITGEWQVSGRSEVNFDKRIKIDAEYVKRKSISHDLVILLKSPIVMVTGKGAV
ncbi:MAG: Undecaprenyl-phosphate galactose phosphotransferase [Candidatus Gottesmanbacteria bacterium GW2011_GWB1_43_11]|uniref:Undecaprenyl-phosphate galactose phosphotransferase n=1 Tax=Candidatus Gottesmanbacteria bacterium GW2011_GWB1_43_11 TaxID=1618446 RepID=A0A0G1CP22_9BACT|nr:MAG: Undecaprenyl-phosphate galactose phosphotransferase [Candidatus Gottesmanbacteria bacterium GW2011_GWA2_42_16]KKS56308.1 MAG: Undecaprenyl-phosphate galactose phosphotransferase [Candidatus Gottesmanbacteria bacterium GW2011_GWA1_42_26]KKS82316.1 MAG: Undecaprenyl-phosphate galactose phosphotransferase [Candidatus Gottesmanbacteria bacterium GW2011_GWC1_43_10]KKS87510.1 MAG: Undecaprenyl-phosphate galactose phosphotransferase [Candidatus Gottesmanbacteria bacterium GW2011_GWB1_43_11]HCM